MQCQPVVVSQHWVEEKFSSWIYCFWKLGATAEYPATIVPDSTCAHIFKERDMCRNKLTQVAGHYAVKVDFLLTNTSCLLSLARRQLIQPLISTDFIHLLQCTRASQHPPLSTDIAGMAFHVLFGFTVTKVVFPKLRLGVDFMLYEYLFSLLYSDFKKEQ